MAVSKIVASVLEPDVNRMRRADALQSNGPDALTELRVDQLRPDEVRGLLGQVTGDRIVTARRPEDGGSFEGSESERRAVLLAALEAGARYVDVEWNRGLRELLDEPAAAGRLILSHHGADCSARTLEPLFDAMAATSATVLKIVPQAGRLDELQAIQDLLTSRGERGLACFAMGPTGVPSRILAPSWGSWATYGSPIGGRAVAPGQLPVQTLRDVYAVGTISAGTALYGLIGSDLARSPSPAMHRAGYLDDELDARYLPLTCASLDEFETATAQPWLRRLAGVGVTMPHKQAAAARCRSLDGFAQAAGAVNTLRPGREGWCGAWDGANTDAPAALEAIGRHLALHGARVAVVGAGGTARGLGAALVGSGAEVVVHNRTAARAATLAAEIGAAHASWEALFETGWDVLVQTTPQGADGAAWFPEEALNGRLVVELVYGSRPTALVLAARRRGLATIDGGELLWRQGLRQYRLLTGRTARPERFQQAIEAWWPETGAGAA